MTTPDALWDEVRHAYEQSSDTLVQIAARHGVSASAITRRRRADGWTMRPMGTEMLKANAARRAAGDLLPEGVPLVEPPAAPLTKAAKPSALGTLTHRKALLKRLYGILDAKIGEVESRIADRPKADGTEAERESREIANILKAYEKLVEFADVPTRAKSTTGDAGDSDDAERLRADIRERIERLRERSVARGTVAGTDGA